MERIDEWQKLPDEWLRTYGADKPTPSRGELVRLSGGSTWAASKLAAWVSLGCPVLQVDAKLAAALMHTDTTTALDYRPPWKAFLVETNEALLLGIRRVFVSADQGTWTVIAWNGERALSTADVPLHDLIAFNEPDATTMNLDMLMETDAEWLAFDLVKRLVLNACLCMSDPGAASPVGKPHAAGHSIPQRRPNQEPKCAVWRLGKPVSIDLRHSVKEYVCRQGRRLHTVQWLVRGHWRNQACGPRLTERRLKWIEPFWKGNENAPINVRPHMLRGEARVQGSTRNGVHNGRGPA